MAFDVIGILAIWLLASLALTWMVQRLCERRQLNALAERLRTDSRIDEATHRSLQAMREAVRRPRH